MVQMLNQHCEHNLQNDLSVQRFDKPHYLESFLSKSLLLCWPSLYRVRATDTRNRPRFSNWGIVLSSSRSSNHSLGNVEMIWKSRNRKSQDSTVTLSSESSESKWCNKMMQQKLSYHLISHTIYIYVLKDFMTKQDF